MKYRCIAVLFLSAVGWIGCSQSGGASLAGLISPERELINLSRVRGTQMLVSSATAEFAPINLVDGDTTVEKWEGGAGWEVSFDGPLLRDRYFDPANDATAMNESFEWEGLRREFRQGKEYSAFAWVIFQFERPRVVERVVVHSVDTEEFPASRFGVRDALVQYWDAPTERWMPVTLREGPKLRDATVRGNLMPALSMTFQPARTDLVRIAVRWTNDAQTNRSFTVMGRREEYVTGTVRLTEAQVFGRREEGDVLTDFAQQRLPDDETVERANAPVGETPAPMALKTVEAYAMSYATRNVDLLMETISPDYDSDGEDAAQLRVRMEQTFEEFPHYDFKLVAPRLASSGDETVVVAAEYRLQLNPIIPRSTEGRMTFVLSKDADSWKIQRIITDPR